MTVGDVLDLAYVASDPNGDRLGIEVISDNASIASAEIPAAARSAARQRRGTGDDHAVGFGRVNLRRSSASSRRSLRERIPGGRAGRRAAAERGRDDQRPDQCNRPQCRSAHSGRRVGQPGGRQRGRGGDQIAISGNAEGTATITADVSDGRGGLGTVTFLVIVEGQIARRD